MPVRKIPKSFRAVTGRFPSVINGRCVSYESKLERDYFLRLEFDRTIKSYEEQPIQIPGTVNGKDVVYTLDCLVTFKTDRRRLLVEVKGQKDLEENSEKLELKFSRTEVYAAKNNLDFQVITENDIYDTALDNYRILYRFAKPPVQFDSKKLLIHQQLKARGTLSMLGLLHALSDQKLIQAGFQSAIWHMLYTGELETDLNSPLGYESEVRLRDG